MLVPGGLNFLMLSFSAGYVSFNLFPSSYKICCDFNTEIPYKRRPIICTFDYLFILILFLSKSKHSEHTSLGLHMSFCLL